MNADLQQFYHGKTVLVTGGAGAIGRNLCERLILLGAKNVIILDNLSSAYKWNIPNHERITFIEGDIRSENDLLHAFHHKPQIVFHLAAFFANQNSVDYPLVNEEVNIGGLIKLLEYCILSNAIERFVFANSEGGAYGKASKLPYQEHDISLDLGSPYYVSKLSGEAYCNYYLSHYGLPVSIVRLFNSYGPGEVAGQYRNVIPNFMYWAMQGKELPLTGDENIARDFVFVQDTVTGILKAGSVEGAIGEAVNIATGKPQKIYDVAEKINLLTGNTAGMRVLSARKWDHRTSIYGDTSKAEAVLGFKAEVDFDAGLEKTYHWFRQNWEQISASSDFPPGKSAALQRLEEETE